jgi:hypothetical protein
MPDNQDESSSDEVQQSEVPKFEPGELTPHWFSTEQAAELSDKAKKKLDEIVRTIGNRDVAARRWEV